MVKNIGGGDKMKHMARKHINGSKNAQSKILRTSTCPDEKYSYVTKILGNGMCLVKGIDGYERLCHIRGKFSGRSKRENTIVVGTWVLVGLRQWDAEKDFASKQTKTTRNIQKCDLLEIYSQSEREKLRIQEKIFQDVLSENSDDEFQITKQSVEFKDQATLEYQEIVEQGGALSRMKRSSYLNLYDNISDSDNEGDDGDGDGGGDNEDGDGEGGDDNEGGEGDDNENDKITHAYTHKTTQSQHKRFDLANTQEIDIDDI